MSFKKYVTNIPETVKEDKKNENKTVQTPISEEEFLERFVDERGQISMLDKDGVMNPEIICKSPEEVENEEAPSVDERLDDVFRTHLNEFLGKMIYHKKINAIGFIQGFAVTQDGVLYASVKDVHYLTPRKITQDGKVMYKYYLNNTTWCSFENCMVFCSLECGESEAHTNDLQFIAEEFYKSNGKSLDEDLLCYKMDEKMSDKEIKEHNDNQLAKSKESSSDEEETKEYGKKSNLVDLAKDILGDKTFNDLINRCNILTERLKGTKVKNEHAGKKHSKIKGATAVVDHIYICWEGDNLFKPYVALQDIEYYDENEFDEDTGVWWSAKNVQFLHKETGKEAINFNVYYKDLCNKMKKLKNNLTKEQIKMFKG